MFDSIRTRHLPLFFAVAGLLLATLFLLFYRLVFQAIDLAFEQQNLASHASIIPHLQKSRQTLVRQARILHVSRGIRRQFAGETDLVILAQSLDVFARRWFERTKNPSIRGVSYLDARRNPIVGIDFQQDDQVVDLGQLADVVPETAAAMGPNVIRGSLTALPSGEMDVHIATLADSTMVLRTLFDINHRRTKALLGHVVVDQSLEDVIDWTGGIDRRLVVYDRQNRHLIYDSDDISRTGIALETGAPDLAQPLSSGASETSDEKHYSTRFDVDKESFLLTHEEVGDPPWDLVTTVRILTGPLEFQGTVLIVASIFFVSIGGLTIYVLVTRIRNRSEALEEANQIVSHHNQMLEQELRTAHDMQMRLMPTSDPKLAGYDIVGHCRPAEAVGGDFFQYFTPGEDRLLFGLADVTGHGMQAAIPTMVFSGLLNTQVEYTPEPQELMHRLNQSLHRVLEKRTFICFSIGELHSTTGTMRISNGGCPFPYHYRTRTGTVDEIDLSAIPLGVRAESAYGTTEITLEPGDVVVLCSDGIIEAANPEGELFGYDRTREVIRQAGKQSLSARQLIQRVLDDVERFADDGKQEDDQTVVVIRAESSAAPTPSELSRN